MQHIKLTVPGSFWDTQLYSGKLLVFGYSGDAFTVDWNNYILERFESLYNLQTVAFVSFAESDLFYTESSRILFKDGDIKRIIVSRFEQLARLDLVMELTGSHVFHSGNPLPFPHADSDVYRNKLYIGLNTGIYSTSCDRLHTAQKNTRLWDSPVLNISASTSSTSIAIATGSNGLHEMRPILDGSIPQVRIVTENHCSSSEWSSQNIVASSHTRSSFFASYRKIKDERNKKKYFRELDKIIELNEIFNGSGYSWGSHDKLYMYKDNSIECIRYSPNKDDSPQFTKIGTLPIENWKGGIASASVATFGTVIELDNAMVVIQSNGEIFTIPGEPVNWRIFSNSRYYKNQLHIIYDDRLEIYSFYHDYFLSQPEKCIGIEMKQLKK
jgi:hypothetical protein